jgi:hypothetical protein
MVCTGETGGDHGYDTSLERIKVNLERHDGLKTRVSKLLFWNGMDGNVMGLAFFRGVDHVVLAAISCPLAALHRSSSRIRPFRSKHAKTKLREPYRR